MSEEDATTQPGELPILLVEDNPDHEELIRRAFADRGVRVAISVARHGEEALDFLFRRGPFEDPERSPRPRLILLDLRLPRVDGLEVLSRIKSSPELHAIPTVVLTTSESEHDVSRACAEHANSYLVKPVEFARFEELIRHVESYWLTLNRQPGGRPPSR
ncbi:MAG TPA: response regulator [Vicinamibacteria bacterium]